MSESRAASRYSKSLLELAEEQGVLEAVLQDMKGFHTLCEESHDFKLMLKNPIIRHGKKNAILKEVFTKTANKLTLAFFDIITRKNREALLPAIAKEFLNQYNIYKNIEVAQVTTAVALSGDLRKKIKDVVSKISSKEKVELVEKVDESLIGGYILKVGDRQIDDSVRNKLKVLELKFSQNPYIKEF